MLANAKMTDEYLTKLVNRTASVYLVNGIKLQGRVIEFDDLSVKLSIKSSDSADDTDDDVQEQLVFRHAVSTVLPVRRKNPQ
jgi:RNA chaperone Hfq